MMNQKAKKRKERALVKNREALVPCSLLERLSTALNIASGEEGNSKISKAELVQLQAELSRAIENCEKVMPNLFHDGIDASIKACRTIQSRYDSKYGDGPKESTSAISDCIGAINEIRITRGQ